MGANHPGNRQRRLHVPLNTADAGYAQPANDTATVPVSIRMNARVGRP